MRQISVKKLPRQPLQFIAQATLEDSSHWEPTHSCDKSGYWWRHSARHLSAAEMRERDSGWIELYGEEAYDAALKSTQWVLDLPPVPWTSAPAGSGQQDDEEHEAATTSGGHPGDRPAWADSERAAWGAPRLWDAHTIDAMSLCQILGLREQAQHRRALPQFLRPDRPEGK